MTTARLIEEYRIGDNVKVLVKQYDSFKSYPGVIVGFEPFQQRPTIVIAYVKAEYNEAEVVFVYLNADTKDIEVCPMLEHDVLLDKGRVIDMFDRRILKAEQELADTNNKKAYFIERFQSLYKTEA